MRGFRCRWPGIDGPAEGGLDPGMDQVETVMSILNRRQGAATRGRSFQARCRDLRLMAITHNVMIQGRCVQFSIEAT